MTEGLALKRRRAARHSFKELVYHVRCGDAPMISSSHPASTIGQLRFGIVPAVSGWGINGAPTDIRTALALSLGLRPFVFCDAPRGREEPHRPCRF
jgi:hypothetical protein